MHGFPSQLNVECEKERVDKDNSKVLGLSNWTDGYTINLEGGDTGRSRFGGEYQQFGFGYVTFEKSTDQSERDVNYEV